MRSCFQKLVLACLTIILAGILFFPKTTIATETEDYLAFPEKDTKQLLSTLIKLMTNEWVDLIASGRATPEEETVPVILREAVRIDALKYLLVDAPVDTAIKITTNGIKIARLAYGLDVSTILREIEKTTVKMAVQKGMHFLLQNEIRLTTGALNIEYVSKKGKSQQAIFQYILVFKPLSQKQGEVSIEIYSPTTLEPPPSRGSGGGSVGTPNALETNLPPFMVKVQGKVMRNSGHYSWINSPDIEISFPPNVPDLGFKPLSFWQRHMWKPLEEKIKEVKIIADKISEISSGFVSDVKSFGSQISSGIKSAVSGAITSVGSYFSGDKPKIEAQIATPDKDGSPPSTEFQEAKPIQTGSVAAQPAAVEANSTATAKKKAVEGKPQQTGKIGEVGEITELLDEIAEQIEILAIETKKITAKNNANKQVKGANTEATPDKIGHSSDFVGTEKKPKAKPETTKAEADTKVETKIETAKPQAQPLEPPEAPTYRPTAYVPSPPPPKLLISEIQVESENGANDEFIELYNPNTTIVSLSGWSLQKMTETGSVYKKNFVTGNVIPANGYFLVVNSYASQGLLALAGLAHNSFGLAENNTIFLVASHTKIASGRETTIIDKVGFGQAASPETSPATTSDNGQTIGRKWLTASQTEQDTDNNSVDFELQTPTPKSQNQALPEPEPQPAPPQPEPEPEPTPTSTPKILITEVQIEGNEKSHDFIELFNHTIEDIDISDFRLKKRTSAGRENSVRVLPEGSIIPANGYFLWVNTDYASASGILADATSTQTLAANNSLALSDTEGTIIDQVAWGTSTEPFVEIASFPQNPPQNYTFGRKIENQEYLDTDNNQEDFELQIPTPRAQNQRDLTSPEAIITSNPPALTNQTQASFTFFANEEGSTFQCKIDEQDWQECTSPINYNGLADGSHLFQVKATDLVGNTSETAEYPWTIDTTIESPSLALSASTTAGLLFTNSQTVFVQVTQDQEAVAWFLSENSSKPEAEDPGWSTEKPSQFTLSPTDGVKTVYVWTKDQANNISQLGNSASITLDTTAPAASIETAPDNPSNQTTSTFVFSCNEEDCDFEYRLDDNEWQKAGQPGSPSRLSLSESREGEHILELKSFDQAGNQSSATNHRWLVDLSPPSSQVEGLASSSTSTLLTINWSGTDNTAETLNYEVQYKDGADGEWQTLVEATTSQQAEFTGQDGHTYYFQSRARDAAGNEEPWPTEHDVFTKIELPKDETAPSSIADLTAQTGENPGEIILTWTAPEDTDHLGQATNVAEYIIKYWVEEITEQDWASSTIISNPPTPQEANTSQSFIVSGLANNTAYYFAIKSKDEAGNTSLLSNSISGETLAAILEVSSNTLNFNAVQDGDNPTSQTVLFENKGRVDMDWGISLDLIWLLSATTSGSLPPNGSTSVEISVDITAMAAGNYQARATIEAEDAKNSPQEIKINLTIEEPPNQSPTALFSYQPPSPFVGEEIIFDASQSSDPDGAVVEYIWDFADGFATTSQSAITSHFFETADQFLVLLTVEDNEQATSAAVSLLIEVSPRPYWKLVISEVQIEDRFSRDHDFVELFNPTIEDIDISGFQLKKRTSSGGEYSVRLFPATTTIPSHTHFLWANTGYAEDTDTNGIGSIKPDATTTQTIAANNSIGLFNKQGEIIDQVAWGAGTGQFVENTALAENPIEDESLTRKKDGNGNYIDTNNNSQDFSLANPTPTNSLGQTGNMLPPAPPAALTALITPTTLTILTWVTSTDPDTTQENISYALFYWDQAELTEGSALATTAGLSSTTTATTTLVLDGFDYNSTYYFGVRAFDGLYYSPVTTTTLHTPLPAINDLAAVPSANREAIDLVWTANGAVKYILKYRNVEISNSNWDTATTVENSLAPKANGEIEFFTIENLPANQVVYFAIKTINQNNATSAVSNSASSTAIAGFQDNGDGTITDLYTGLVWVKDGNNVAANNGTTTTQSLAADYILQLNTTIGFANHFDWRLPNYKELASIVNYNKTAPTVYSAFSNIQPDKYWSNSKHLYWNRGWYVDFGTGKTDQVPYAPPNSPRYYFLPVRGPVATSSLQETGIAGDDTGCLLGFLSNGTTTKTDLCTGLMWTNTLTGIGYTDEFGEAGVNWRRAMQVAQDSEIGGYSDWRLPNIRELINVSKILASPKDLYWTATPDYFDLDPATDRKWYVDLRNNPGKTTNDVWFQSRYILLVRKL